MERRRDFRIHEDIHEIKANLNVMLGAKFVSDFPIRLMAILSGKIVPSECTSKIRPDRIRSTYSGLVAKLIVPPDIR